MNTQALAALGGDQSRTLLSVSHSLTPGHSEAHLDQTSPFKPLTPPEGSPLGPSELVHSNT